MQLLLRKMLGLAGLGARPVKMGTHSAGSVGALTGPALVAAPCHWALVQAETGCFHADVLQDCSAEPDRQGLIPVLMQPLHRCHQP